MLARRARRIWCFSARGSVAPPAKPKSGAERVLTGCVDEDGAGCYVLLDDRMQEIVTLKAAAPDDRMFTRSMGHEVGVKEPNLPARSCASAGRYRSVLGCCWMSPRTWRTASTMASGAW